MHGTYDFWLVLLSFIVAALTSYTALDLSGHISQLKRPILRHIWLIGGAIVMGVGIWSMHFIGMLALSLPITLGYDLYITGYSLVIAILLSYCVLQIVTREKLSFLHILSGGILMGFAIAGMHYTGMAALLINPGIDYDPTLFYTSIFIAIVAASAALWIVHSLNDRYQDYLFAKRISAAVVMGIAITGMHYTGMASAHFPVESISEADKQFNSQWLATTILMFTFGILSMRLMLSRFMVSQLNTEIVRMAKYDSLTNLPNRPALIEKIESAIASSKRDRNMFAILFLDLDGFKVINDSLGHLAGDEILKTFAERLRDCVRRNDTVARLGGDEFVVLISDINSPADATQMADSILNRMRQGFWADGHPLQVMPSIGITLFPQDASTANELLKNADVAMYEAKRTGRGKYRFFETSMYDAANRNFQIQCVLHDALKCNYFSLHFQPKFRSDNKKLIGAEALIRLNHPDFGLLPPDEFIPPAERSGQIVQIGYWVMHEACRQMRSWRNSGLPMIKMAINLSPRQLIEDDLVTTMLEIVKSEHVSSEYFIFEITETVAMQDADKTTRRIREFKANGFEVAIDDFGTGYSSLAYLQRFRAKQLKIDRFFTNGLDEQDHESKAIVSAIIKLAHSLDMDVVAEGVETASQFEKLKSMKCDEVQGFLLGKPLSAEEFSKLMHQSDGGESDDAKPIHNMGHFQVKPQPATPTHTASITRLKA